MLRPPSGSPRPLGGLKLGAVEAAIGDLPAMLEIGPALLHAPGQEESGAAMIVRVVIVRIGGNGGIIVL